MSYPARAEGLVNSTFIYIYIRKIPFLLFLPLNFIYTGFGQYNRNTWKYETNLFWYGFPIAALSWNPALVNSLCTGFEETGFSRKSLSSAVIFGAVFLCFFLSIRVRVRRSLSLSYRFLLQRGYFFLLPKIQSLLSRQYSLLHQIIHRFSLH